MADFGVGDLWWLKPGGGQDPTIGSQWLQGMRFGAEQKQQGIANMFEAERVRNESIRMHAAADAALAKQVTDAQKAAGFAEINSHLANVAETKSWDDPKAEAEFWRIAGRYPHVIDHNELDTIYKNTFVETRQRNEKAREVDQREERLRAAEEDRTSARFHELEIKQQRADIYGEKTQNTADFQKAQQAFKEAQAETDNKFKARKLEIASGLLDVAQQKADTSERIAEARERFLERKAAQLERGLAPGEATMYRSEFESLRDLYQFPQPGAKKLSSDEYQARLQGLIEKYHGTKPPGATPPPAGEGLITNPKDPLGLFK
jgi:hypothetical protein